MLLQLTDDQEFFRETTARYLDEKAPVNVVRAQRDDPDGYDPAYWRGGAELGWTSLLVSPDHGGGSITDKPLVDLCLVAHELGTHAAPGPFATTNVVASALSAAGSHLDVVAEILAGTAVAPWCLTEPPPHHGLGAERTTVTVDGGQVVIDGVKRPVESAGTASHFLVVGRTGDGVTQVLVPADAPGVSIEPMASVDLTRRFATVRFDGVHLDIGAVVGEVGAAADAVERQLQIANVLLDAESVGAMQRGFDITLEWGFDRYSFGRPLVSYQALKHRYADMTWWLQASHAIADAAADAVATGSADAAELASASAAYVGDHGSRLLQDCVQLHGGIGVTYEHDLHLFLRRQALNRTLFGAPADHRRRIGAALIHEAAS